MNDLKNDISEDKVVVVEDGDDNLDTYCQDYAFDVEVISLFNKNFSISNDLHMNIGTSLCIIQLLISLCFFQYCLFVLNSLVWTIVF